MLLTCAVEASAAQPTNADGAASSAQQPEIDGATSPGLAGLFSKNQAQRGAQLFIGNCSQCHTPAQMTGLALKRGARQSLGELFERVSTTMPPEGTKLPGQDYLDIFASIFLQQGTVAGTRAALVTDPSWRHRVLESDGAVGELAKAPQRPAVEWTAYRANLLSQGYSPADQVDRSNVSDLKIAWRWSGRNAGPLSEIRNITTPLMIDGVLYFTAGLTRNVVAVDAETGETLWMWRPQETPERFEQAPRKGSGRGVAYWRGPNAADRVLTVTPGFQLVALDAKTGRPIPEFGNGGVVDLQGSLRRAENVALDIGSSSPPLVLGDVVVVGPAHHPGTLPPSRGNVKGDVQAFDVRHGSPLWTFKAIPDAEHVRAEDWSNGSALYTGNAGVWAPMSADPELDLIYLPVESPTNDYYGGQRLGRNKYANSLVCLEAKTGRMRWHFQLTHHDIWDWDLPAAPILFDIPRNNGITKAVGQITKQGFLYAFNRVDGKPLWPVIERRVPQSKVPGEVTSPTQPVPTLPAAFDRQGMSAEDLIDFTPQLRAEALEFIKSYELGAMYAPPALADVAGKTKGTLTLPSVIGGGNWEGGAVDPESSIVYVSSASIPSVVTLHAASQSDAGYVANVQMPTMRGLPLVKPPWGRITAIDMKSGTHLWMQPNGSAPQSVKSHPALQGVRLGRTGKPTRAGILVTKTLLFAGEGFSGDPVLWAYDKASGEVLAEISLPGAQTGLPMTYVWKDRQFIVMSVGNGQDPAEVVALALP